MRLRDHARKMLLPLGMLLLYVAVGVVVLTLVHSGSIARSGPDTAYPDQGNDNEPLIGTSLVTPAGSLHAAVLYLQNNFIRQNGHINLYIPLNTSEIILGENDTNSEAVSYYLQVSIQNGNKTEFDRELDYAENYMIHPTGGYLMWRLNGHDKAVGDGENIAPDADLRMLHALYAAKDLWHDQRYDHLIDQLASALENVALTDDDWLAAYGGMSGSTPWKASMSYLAYSDFQVYDRLANTRGDVWRDVNARMRNITLEAQIWNGLYNSEYFSDGRYGNGIDGGVYSINSMWIMVRFAESGDPRLMQSARKSLAFYEQQYKSTGHIYDSYTSSGEPGTQSESPWTYALIGRAASALGEGSFAQIMEGRLRSFQELDKHSPFYGAFIEGSPEDQRVGQFTMEESILTMQQIHNSAIKVN